MNQIKVFFAYWLLARIIFFFAPWPFLFYHLFNWFHLIWNDSFIVKIFSFNISRAVIDMPENVTMEGSLQSCRGFVQSKRKGFNK
jgi:hypothetical protein